MSAKGAYQVGNMLGKAVAGKEVPVRGNTYSLGVREGFNPVTKKLKKKIEIDKSGTPGWSNGVRNGNVYSLYTPEKG